MDTQTIENLEPTAYLGPDRFKTPNDGLPPPGYAEEQYRTGRRVSEESTEIIIAVNGVWGAFGKDGSSTVSYERIGYHSCTAPLLRGFLDGPAEIVVCRWTADGFRRTVIRPARDAGPAKDAA
jgi:hypothetical protein